MSGHEKTPDRSRSVQHNTRPTKELKKLSVVTHAYNLSTWKDEARAFPGQPGFHKRVHSNNSRLKKTKETQELGNMYFWSRKKKGALSTQSENVHRVSGLDGGDTRQFIPCPGVWWVGRLYSSRCAKSK